ncbi:TPA: hypothetical protein ACH3X3_006549 [Trebouxia sp. C0006]
MAMGPLDELSEREKQMLGGFWVYVLPMSLYRHIQQRQQFQAAFLRRSLTYHKAKPLAASDRCTELSMVLSLESEDATCSVFVIVCKKIPSVPASGRKSAMEFEPLSVQLLKLGKSSGHDSSTAVNVKVHYQHQHQSAQLGVMLLTAGDPLVAHSLDALKKRTKKSKAGANAFSLTNGCMLDKAFGLIPSGDEVFWHFTELPARWDMQLPLKLKARLRKGMMKTVAAGTECVLQLTSQAVQGPIFDMQLGLQPHKSTRPKSTGGNSCSHKSGRAQAGSTGSHTPVGKPSGCGQEHDRKSGTVHFCYYFHNGQRHVKEATTNFTCFACKQTCNGFLGLKHHIEASHDLFDFTYTQGGAGVVPTVTVRCPGGLYDRQGRLQNPEAGDIGRGSDCKEFYFECRSKKLRALRLQQYGMTDKERASLPARLTHNQFNKAAWKSWHASMHEDEQQSPAKATASSASQAHPRPPLPLRPFFVNLPSLTHPHPPPIAPGASHAEATASTSINHSAVPIPMPAASSAVAIPMPAASSAVANGGRGPTARAKTSNGGDDDATANRLYGAIARAKTSNGGDDDATANGGRGATARAKTSNGGDDDATANGGRGATARAKTSDGGDDDATANGGYGATARAKTGNSGGDDEASASVSASAKTGKPPVGGQRQVQSRKRGRPGHLALGSQERPAPVYFHARSCSRMTPQEVAHILQDPHAVPDSDDEEDDRERSKSTVKCLNDRKS